MHDPTPELKPNASQIVVDAMNLAAAALARWLERPVNAERISTSCADIPTAERSLASPELVLCCCTMPVDIAIGSLLDPSLPCSDLGSSAGRLLMAWTSVGAARLIDHSLHHHGTTSDQTKWLSLHRSVIAETSNVVGCEFLNAIASRVSLISDQEVSLIPRPPQLSQQFAGRMMDAAVMEVESSESNAGQHHVWLAEAHFQVASQSINTRFAMVWKPSVWHRLTELVEGPFDNMGGQ